MIIEAPLIKTTPANSEKQLESSPKMNGFSTDFFGMGGQGEGPGTCPDQGNIENVLPALHFGFHLREGVHPVTVTWRIHIGKLRAGQDLGIFGPLRQVEPRSFRENSKGGKIRQLGPDGFFEGMDYQPAKLGQIFQPRCRGVERVNEKPVRPVGFGGQKG